MKLGLYGINIGACIDPSIAAEVARAAERAGFDSLWTAEHVVLPDPQTPESPIPAATPLLDPAVALAWAAAHTTSIRLATGIIILPQRNPAVLAKEIRATELVILTAVERVALNFGRADQQPLSKITLSQAKRFHEIGHFPPGSMGPKIEAAIDFLEAGGERVIITDLDHVGEAIDGKAGTLIVSG